MIEASKTNSMPSKIPQASVNRQNPQPSRLELMQMQMQQRHMREKEEKLLAYQQSTHNGLHPHSDRPARFNSNNAFDNNNNQQPGAIRRFFQERRELSDQSEYLPNIDQHYKKVVKKNQSSYMYQQPNNGSQVRTYGGTQAQRNGANGRLPPMPLKNSAGRDKSHPLAPIDRTPKQTPQHSRHSSRRSSAQSNTNKVPPPMNGRNRYPRPTHFEHAQHEQGEYASTSENSLIPRGGVGAGVDHRRKQTNFRDWRDKQKQMRDMSHQGVGDYIGDNGHPRRMTDFEKWQMEQDAARDHRLQGYHEANGHHDMDDYDDEMPHNSHLHSRSPRHAPQFNRTFSPQTMREEKVKQRKNLLQNRVNTRRDAFPPTPRRDDDSARTESKLHNDVTSTFHHSKCLLSIFLQTATKRSIGSSVNWRNSFACSKSSSPRFRRIARRKTIA